MKLLFVTQALDLDDPVLSVYHAWVEALVPHFEYIEVICLKEGRHSLPATVRVHSLGKEKGGSSLLYASRFLALIFHLRTEYDAVFLHMNQEYALLGGVWWKLWSKRVYLWRNHYAGSFLTDVAASFCESIFYTSKHSYTARYRHALPMPVGVDTTRFFADDTARVSRSILFLARMAPTKRPEVLVAALRLLTERGVQYRASFYGSPAPENESWYANLTKDVADLDSIAFFPGVKNDEAPALFRRHEVFVNASPSGMLDKTLFEAAACGTLALASSEDWREAVGSDLSFDGNPDDLARKLEVLLAVPEAQRDRLRRTLTALSKANSLATLASHLAARIVGA